MNFKDYQKRAYGHIKPHDSIDLEKSDWALGLAGESGEVIELIKHNVMHKENIDRFKLAKEISDVLWYCAALATVYGISLDAAAELNLAKLAHRHNGTYNREGSENRHSKEAAFSDTEQCKAIMAKLFIEGGE